MVRRVPLRLGTRSYEVLIGPGVRDEPASVLHGPGAARTVVVSARPREWVPGTGIETPALAARDGEEDENPATVEALRRESTAFGPTRHDAVVSCGGGRHHGRGGARRGAPPPGCAGGAPADVPARPGRRERRGEDRGRPARGKNLVGAYGQPGAAPCDTDHLTTLPRREPRDGLGGIAGAVSSAPATRAACRSPSGSPRV